MTHSVAIAQISPKLGDVKFNLDIYGEQVEKACRENCQLVLFPELTLTGYFLRDAVPDAALKLNSPEIEELKRLSRKISFIAGLVEETRDFRFYNSAVYFEAGEIKHVHRKVYLPTYGMFDEQRYFSRGDRVRAFESKFGRIAILICEDFWHPSTVYLSYLDGASIVVCLSASPLRGLTNGQRRDNNSRYWEMIIQTYALEYGFFIAYANRAGFEDGVGFWGGSEIVDPFGRKLAKGLYYKEDFIIGDIDLELVPHKRKEMPWLRDEDIDLTLNELMRIRQPSGC